MTESNTVVQQLRDIVGADNAFPFSGALANPQRAIIGTSPAGCETPVAVVLPESVEQIQALLAMLGPLAYSVTTIPNASGNGARVQFRAKPSVVVDLRRMDKIIEVNVDSGYALIEPGVSFDQLRNHLIANDAGYWIDCDTNGANSVCGSILERSFGYTPYGDHLMMQCGMEVVMANAEVLRTGMGAVPGSDTWQLFKYNYGPYLDGLFSRSDMGIVTKIGVWLMPAPPAYHPFMVSLPNGAALAQAVEVLRPLKIQMVVPNTVVVSHRSSDAALLRAAGQASVADALVARSDPNLSEWNLFGALYGIPDNVQLTWQMVAAAFGTISGAEIATGSDAPSHPVWPLREQLMRGEPAYSTVGSEKSRDLWFSASGPLEGEAAGAMSAVVTDGFAAAEIPFDYEFLLTWRTLFMRVSIPYGVAELDQRREAVLVVANRLSEAGFSISHDSPELTAAITQAHTSTPMNGLQASLSAVLDPKGILRL
ncbi:MAG: FAD-binding oxidoreductase [Proteobacteria bacterium]|nr:FAD-binding oxidoreductase [Pseudomonadota bacterium]